MSNPNAVADIDVLYREEDLRCGEPAMDSLDLYFRPNNAPDLCMGLDLSSSEIVLYVANEGKVVEYYVESPIEAGSMSEYTPADAVRAILDEVGIDTDANGLLSRTNRFTADLATMVSSDAIQKNVAATQLTRMDDLLAAVEDAYQDMTWE